MQAFASLKKILAGNTIAAEEKNAVEAYELWSAGYDNQPGNLMLDLDESIFSAMLTGMELKGRSVADIGCGTGRHWNKIYDKDPARLTGFDISEGMLAVLNKKFPGAETHCITDNLFNDVKDAGFDIIISTLTVAHIKNIEQALAAWCRILKKDGEMIITDYHPDTLANGGTRSFSYEKKQLHVTNYVHSLDTIRSILSRNGFSIVRQEVRCIDSSVKDYYARKNSLHVFEKFKDMPVVYGLHVKRTNDLK